jgi:hypothetical protein
MLRANAVDVDALFARVGNWGLTPEEQEGVLSVNALPDPVQIPPGLTPSTSPPRAPESA